MFSRFLLVVLLLLGVSAYAKVDVPKDAKCAVCGMKVAKYPNWVAVIEMNDGHKHYFDGVKDMMKFYLYPEKFKFKKESAKDILVTDYYTLKQIDAKKAWYVLGSNVFGPMGDELIPFKTKKDAEAFLKEHNGKSIVQFDKVDAQVLSGLKMKMKMKH